ncbi:MAG: hypothetical protein ACXV7E_02395, partial [Methylobacter sp.]
IIAGISLDRLGMPPVAQPIHLLMANLIFGAQFFLFTCLRYASAIAPGSGSASYIVEGASSGLADKDKENAVKLPGAGAAK